MPEEIQSTVKVPISEIVASLRRKHELPSKLTGVRIEGNAIVLNFREGGREPAEVWTSNEPKKRKELEESVNEVNEDSLASVDSMNEEEPAEYEKTTENAETMNEGESIEDEKARERKRFWKK